MNSRPAFVAVGMAINALVLARGVILMLALSYIDLGYVALVQAAITFVGMLHFGLLNGGYRLLCHAGPRTRQRIVDLAYTGFAACAAALSVVGFGVAAAMSDPIIAHIAAFAVVGGVATLMRAWMMNALLATQRLGAANAINALSSLASVAVLTLLIPQEPIAPPALIAVSAIAAQPLVFVALGLATGSALRPRSFKVSRWLVRMVLRAGLSLFVAGLALQGIPLVERAYVSRELGLEALGHLYLAFLFVTLFQMAPNLIQQVFLAPVVERWRAKDTSAVRRELRRFFAATMAYCGAVALALWVLAEPLVALALPQYTADLRWVYGLAPGLIVFALSAPFTLSCNVMIDYRWYLIAYMGGAAVTLGVFGAAVMLGQALSLDQVVGLRSAGLALMGLTLIIGSHRLTVRAPELRLFGPAPLTARA